MTALDAERLAQGTKNFPPLCVLFKKREIMRVEK